MKLMALRNQQKLMNRNKSNRKINKEYQNGQ